MKSTATAYAPAADRRLRATMRALILFLLGAGGAAGVQAQDAPPNPSGWMFRGSVHVEGATTLSMGDGAEWVIPARPGGSGSIGYGFTDRVTIAIDVATGTARADSAGMERDWRISHASLIARLTMARGDGRWIPFATLGPSYVAGTWEQGEASSVDERTIVRGWGAVAGAGVMLFALRELALEASAELAAMRFSSYEERGAARPSFPTQLHVTPRLRLGLTWYPRPFE